MALAYFITFSTYGTWLPGAGKGKGSVDRQHNTYAQPFVTPNPNRQNQAKVVMSQPPYTLDAPRREVVRDAIVTLCRLKQWTLHAAHVRSNHVHVVITADREAGRLMSELKACASRDLTRAGFESKERIRWTRHGSTQHLFDMSAVVEKIDYTLNKQGTPMAFHDGRQPIPKEPRTK